MRTWGSHRSCFFKYLSAAAGALVLAAGAIVGSLQLHQTSSPGRPISQPQPFELYGIAGNVGPSNQLKAYAFNITPPKDYSDESFNAEIRQRVRKSELALVANPFESTEALRTWAVQLTAGATDDLQKARTLFETLCVRRVERPLLKSRGYRTAKQIFLQWNNAQEGFICEEFDHIYVALARAAGLRAYGVAVEQDCYGMRNLHACAAVFVSGHALLVDPAYLWFGVPHKDFTVLDDLQSTAVQLSGDGDLRVCRIAARLGADLLVVQVSVFDKLAGEQRWAEARKVARSLVRSHPNTPAAYYAKAVLAQADQNNDEAAALLQKAIQLAPNTPEYYGMLGNTWQLQGKFEEARAAYENALRYSRNQESVEMSLQAIGAVDAALKQTEVGKH
jgi:tetratricopeptide (TPR) repeat protein